MSETFYFEIVEWPGGYGFAGACGGGVGRTMRRFAVSGVQLEKLREILNRE